MITQRQILKKGDNCDLFLICSQIKRVNYAANIGLKVDIKELFMLIVRLVALGSNVFYQLFQK